MSAEAEMRMYENKQEFYEKHPEYKHSVAERDYHDEMSSLIQVLTDSYEVLLIADLDKDTYHIIKQNASSIKAGEPTVGIYSERNDNFCNDYISDDFRELRRKVGSISNLKKQLKDENHIICNYRLKNGQWRESAFWKTGSNAEGEPTKIIYYSQGLDRSMAERISHRRKAEKEIDVMARLGEIYRSVSLIDLQTEDLHLYQNITLPDSMADILSNSSYSDAIERFANEFLPEKSKQSFIAETALPNIRKELKSKKTYNVLCRIKEDMQETAAAKYEKFSFCFSDDTYQTIVMATKDITDAIEWGLDVKD